jgi:hypothetical protein
MVVSFAAMSESIAQVPRTSGVITRWWAFHFSNVDRKEAWGYGVWSFFGVLVAVPELWAAISSETARWPTISATVGYIEYHHVWVSLVVAGVIVAFAYSALRYRVDRTGVLPVMVEWKETGGIQGDPALPYRTPRGLRLTRSVSPVAEVSAGVYFGCSLIVIAVCTGIAAAASDIDDEYAVGLTLYGLTAAFWVVVPMLLAWPKRWSVDIPFLTLFETFRSLDRRLRGVALVVAAGMVILLIHLVFYPWPATIPDIQDLHEQYKGQGEQGITVPEGPPSPTAP